MTAYVWYELIRTMLSMYTWLSTIWCMWLYKCTSVCVFVFIGICVYERMGVCVRAYVRAYVRRVCVFLIYNLKDKT